MRNNLAPGSLLLVFCTLLGCSKGTLDRKTAAKEIQSHLDVSSNILVVELGRVGPNCAFVDKKDGRQVSQDLSPDKALSLVVAIKAGYIAAVADGGGYWKTSLTETGKAAQAADWRDAPYHNDLSQCDYRLSAFRIAAPELVRVNGISGDEKSPDVDFEWKWTPTELGKALRKNGDVYSKLTSQQQTRLQYVIQTDGLKVPIPVPDDGERQKDTAAFKKYDDGWRSK